MPYIGRDLNRGNYLKLDDISSSFNSSTKTFNLTVGGSAFTPGSAFSILVSVGGVIQEPESAYQVNNSEITFANAPTAQDGFFCIALGVPISIGVPGNGTVNGTQMAKPFNYDGFFYLNDANNRVGINSSIPTVALDVIGDTNISGDTSISGDVNVSGILTAGTYSGPISNPSGISTFYNLRVTNNLTVEGTTSTLDTDLIGVDRVEVGANSNSIVGVAVTQSGTADLVNLFDGASQVVTVDDTGKVGLGTDNPSQLLHLTKDSAHRILLKRGGAAPSEAIFANEGSYTNISNNSAGVKFSTGSTPESVMVIRSGGNVGLGTDNPSRELHVLGTGEVARFQSTNSVSTIRLYSTASNHSEIGHTGDLYFAVNGERLRIQGSTGNVGIGSAIPANVLDVQGTTHTKIHVGTTGTGHATGIQINHAKGNAALQEWQLQTDGSADGNLKIRNATSSTDVMFFDADNNRVSINETTPDTQLHISGNANAQTTAGAGTNTAIRITDTDTSAQSGQVYGEIQFETRDATSPGVAAYITAQGNSSGSAALNFGTGSGGSASTKMTIHQTGNASLGYQYTVPNEYSNQTTFTINGNTYGRLDLEVAGALRGSVWANTGGLGLDAGAYDMEFFTGSAQSLKITGTGSLQHTAASGVSYFTGSSEYLFNSTTSCPTQGGNEARVQINENKTRATMSINAFMNNTGGPNLTFISSRSGTIGVLGTKCNDGDMLGQIRFRGDNATVNGDLAAGGQIECRARSTPADGDTIIAGELKFYTGSGSAGSMLERLTINKDGNIGIGEDNPQTVLHINNNVPMIRLTDANASGTPDCEIGGAGGNIDISADINGEKADSVIRLNVDGGQKVLITSGGQVRIGNANNLALWGQNNRLQVAGTDWNTSGITIACMSNSGSANLVMGNSKASTPGGSGGALTQDNRLAYISFVGDDGTDMNTVGAAIVAELDSNASSNSMPARLSFYTGGNQTRRMRIASDGRVLIGRDSTTSISTNAALTIQNPTNSSATRFNLINSGSSQPESTQIYSQNDDLAFVAGASERLRIGSSGMVVFQGGSGNVDQVKIESQGGGTGIYIANFQGVDAGDASSRLGVGKNDNALIFTNASGTQISNFAIGNTDSIPLILSTANTRRIHIRGDGRIIMGTGIPTYTNSIVHVEGSGINVETEYTLEDGTGASPQFSIFGSNSHVRIDMGTLDVAPYAGYIQARYDNDPEQTGSSNSGLEPLMLNPRGGVLGYNIHDSSGMNAIGNGLIGTQGGIVMRSGRANSTTVNNASTAIKIFPGEIRAYSGSGGTGEQNEGTKYGGIAWNVLDPHNGNWGTNHNGHHCWMGMSLHSTPAQEKSNWQVQMNNNAGAGTYADIVAIQANPEGYVTTPNQPSFCAIKNTSHYYFTSGQRTTISGWTERHDTHSDFDPSSGVFTAPIKGTYFFYCSVMQDRNDNGDFQLSLFRDGTMYVNSNDMTSTGVTFQQTTINAIVNLEKNDTVDFRGYNSTSTSSLIYKNSYTHCGGYLIG